MKFFTLFVSLFSLLFCYERPPYVEPAIWEFVSPYLLPENHPVKEQLDNLFSKKRYIKTSEAIENSSFKILHENPRSGLFVLKHSKLKGYVIKVLPDERTGECEWCQFAKRIQGAQAIKNVIDRNNWGNKFLVPKKWIYLIPYETYREGGKAFLLVAEDMKPLSNSTCKKIWRSGKITPETLNPFFNIVKEAGLIDCLWLRNIPFNKQGQIIFLDTEHFDQTPVPYYKLSPYLSREMQSYWKKLTSGS